MLEARLRRQRGCVLGPPQHADQLAHLRERLAARLLDYEQRFPLALLVGTEQPPHAGGLDGHDADAMPHDIVQLARDPCPFLGDGRARLGLSIELEPCGTLAKLGRLARARAEDETGEPGGDEEAPDPRNLPEAVVELLHNECKRGEGDRNARVRNPALLRGAEDRHCRKRAEKRKREVVACLVRDRGKGCEQCEARGRRS
jgi:hypothetical protein